MLWLNALHSRYWPKWKKNSTEFVNCTHMHWHYNVKNTLNNISNTIQPWGFHKQRGATVLLVLCLEIKNKKSAKYIKHVLKSWNHTTAEGEAIKLQYSSMITTSKFLKSTINSYKCLHWKCNKKAAAKWSRLLSYCTIYTIFGKWSGLHKASIKSLWWVGKERQEKSGNTLNPQQTGFPTQTASIGHKHTHTHLDNPSGCKVDDC